MHERHGDTAGGKRSRLYVMWVGMRERCGRPSHQAYQWYGARGIAVCAEWAESFTAFRRWALASGYRADKSIDRIDNAKGYSPDNCRWATDKAQARNQRPAKTELTVVFRGAEMSLRAAAALSKIGYTTLVKRFHAGQRGDELFRPPRMHTDHERRARAAAGNGNAKLLPDQIEEIRRSAESGASLARRMRVAESTISMIRSGARR